MQTHASVMVHWVGLTTRGCLVCVHVHMHVCVRVRACVYVSMHVCMCCVTYFTRLVKYIENNVKSGAFFFM